MFCASKVSFFFLDQRIQTKKPQTRSPEGFCPLAPDEKAWALRFSIPLVARGGLRATISALCQLSVPCLVQGSGIAINEDDAGF
jgi:hypothetical protein